MSTDLSDATFEVEFARGFPEVGTHPLDDCGLCHGSGSCPECHGRGSNGWDHYGTLRQAVWESVDALKWVSDPAVRSILDRLDGMVGGF